MKGINLLIERAERNRMRYKKAVSAIEKVAKSKIDWCDSLTCSYDKQWDDYIIVIKINSRTLKVNAERFLYHSSGMKKITKVQFMKYVHI